MQAIDISLPATASAIAWAYLMANSARVISYIPQITAVSRSRDGARAVSLLTWGYWMVSHLIALLYGAFVLDGGFRVAISLLTFVCCAAVSSIVVRRRGLSRVQMLFRPPRAAIAGRRQT